MMFTITELKKYVQENDIVFSDLKQYLLEKRLGISVTTMQRDKFAELSYFSSAVLGSIATLEGLVDREWENISLLSADIEYMLYLESSEEGEDRRSHIDHLLRAALLYEIGGLPSVTALMAKKKYFMDNTYNFLSRNKESGFGKLSYDWEQIRCGTDDTFDRNVDLSIQSVDEALSMLERFMQRFDKKNLEIALKAMDIIAAAASLYSFDINADEALVTKRIIEKRGTLSVSNYLSKDILSDLVKSKLPSELWGIQGNAIKNGLLSESYNSWGLAAPTGTGKTALAQILLIWFFKKNPDKKAFYIVPSRALAAQVAKDLKEVLEPLGINVGALGSHLTFDKKIIGDTSKMDLLIFTPEKADLILRIEPDIIAETKMVIVDEAHHIEAGTRGILLEFYLWRLKSLIPKECRIIQLSAVAPNIDRLVGWLSEPQNCHHLKMDWRPGRFRIGTYEVNDNLGVLSFIDCKPLYIKKYEYTSEREKITDDIVQLGNLAHILSKQGVVLILATSKAKAQLIAQYIEDLRKDFLKNMETSELTYSMESLDAKLERELYAEVPLRKHISFGVAYHHSGLPSRVRAAVEQVIAEKKVNIVCATTTLAEGVNFPFSTVIVESLIIGINTTLSPRELWNIAGRAGRFGVDAEGHCILFRPSKFQNKIKGYKLADYLDMTLDSIPPVKSAFADALNELKNTLNEDIIKYEDLEEVSLQTLEEKIKGARGKNIRGMVNMMRVGLAHAHASKILNINSETKSSIIEGMLAYGQIDEETKEVTNRIENSQRKVLSDYLLHDEELLRIAAKTGWSIESQDALWKWIKQLEDWQIGNFGKILWGGKINNPKALKALLYPVADLMTEFEGPNLGGFTAYIAEYWIYGYPLTEIRTKSTRPGAKPRDFSVLVDILYSRIQYLLPWALYGVHELLSYEAKNRRINFGSGVRDLSLLSSEGVPNFDALTLVLSLDIERVDATRLSVEYSKKGQHRFDIVNWFKSLDWVQVEYIVRGMDQRRVDFDLKEVHKYLK